MVAGEDTAQHHLQQGAGALATVQATMTEAGAEAEGVIGVEDAGEVETAQPQAVGHSPMAVLQVPPLRAAPHRVAGTGRAPGVTVAGVVAGQAGATLEQRVQASAWAQV